MSAIQDLALTITLCCNHCMHRISSEQRALLLDLGDTLIPATRVAALALSETITEATMHGVLKPDVALGDAFAAADHADSGAHVNHLFSSESIVARAYAIAGEEYTEENVREFLSIYRAHVRGYLVPDPALRKSLERVVDAGVAVGVVTDGTTAEQAETLRRLGIEDLVAVLTTSEDLGVEKPHPRMFETALGKLGVSRPAESIMVGDSLPRDIAGGQNVGMKTALMTRFVAPSPDELSRYSPDYVISDLADILPLLR